MRALPIVVGALAGVGLALGGIAAIDLATEPAEGQGASQFVTKAEFEQSDSANQRRIAAARRSAVNNFNLLGRFLAPAGEVIGVNQPPGVIRQLRGTGSGGLPGSTLADGAVSEQKLAPPVQSKLNATNTGPQGPQGPAGPPGPAGEVPATFSEGPVGGGFSPPPIDGNFNVILNSNGSLAGTRSGGTLTLEEPRRVSAHGWVNISNGGGGDASVGCFPAARSQPGPSTSGIGIRSEADVPANGSVQISLSGSRDLDPDEYEILVICQSADPGITAERASVSAVVTDPVNPSTVT